MMTYSVLVVVLAAVVLLQRPVAAQFDPYFVGNRSVIVHLFEWKWQDVARECVQVLGPRGFGGVQVSPPNEYSVIDGRPWWERYQPVSYRLQSRSGDATQFAAMVRTCTAAGVRIYVDTVINHMSATAGRGTAGSKSVPANMEYPGVPYAKLDFHAACEIRDYSDPVQVRNCQLVGLPDLNQTLNWVQDRMVEYLNELVGLGVAGFRVDAAKHMWPTDLRAIYARVHDLNATFNFPAHSRPFIYQEVIDLGGEGVSRDEYTDLGRVTEFRAGASIGNTLRNNWLHYVDSWGEGWNFMASTKAVVFVENHDSERSQGGPVLTYKTPRLYRMAVAFFLAHPYGVPKVMSSFAFEGNDQGPPQDADGNIVSPNFDEDREECGHGWVCQHRWRQVAGMVAFRNYVQDAPLVHWWTDGADQIAFARDGRGFVAFNNVERQEEHLIERLQTSLPTGTYCDVMTGEMRNGTCTGYSVTVNDGGWADIVILADESDGVLAIHIGAKL